MRCEDSELLLGSYALKGLEPDEAARVEAHLAGCDRCRDAYARIAALPAMLDLLQPAGPAPAPPPSHLEAAVVAAYGAERPSPRRRRRVRGGDGGRRWPAVAAGALAGAVATILV